jgi:transketolase
MGIMEQGTVGIAAGMAMTGLIPIIYSIVNFLAFRAIEQTRNDVLMQKLNVKFVSTGVNDYFHFLGFSHCCGDDDKKIMQIINMKVFDPYERINVNFDKMVEEWITDTNAGYIRV